jgi:NAD(P)-dependent dehydrogenase (short-subunit alcohol dehydrogenase family)
MQLAGATALVTGGAVGVGRGIALALRAAGADVWIADVQDPPDDDAGRFVRTDVTDEAALRELFAAARPGVLVNNAGGLGHIPPHFPESDRWEYKLDLNLRAPMRAAQLALEHGARAIVNIASMAGTEDGPGQSPEYAAAKAGLIRFTTALPEWRGARLNCVVPDWIATERALAELGGREPDAPMVSVDTVAEAVLALVRDDGAAGRVVVLRGDRV